MRWFVAVAMGIGLAGCSGGDGKGDAEALVFEAANNYEFEGTFTIETYEVAPGEHFCVDWSAIGTDIRGRAFDPADVDQVAFLQFDADQPGVLEEIDTNQLRQDDAAYQYLWDQTGGATSACSQDFEIIGNFFDPALLVEESDKTWVLSLIDLDLGKNDILMTAFVAPTVGATATEVALSDTTAILDYTVDIDGKPGIVASAAAGSWTLDWSSITDDVNGVPFDALLGDELLIAHYADYAEVSEVESVFLRLDTEATETYVLDVFGEVDADLSEAETAEGDGFGGFTTDGVWLVAISCTTCTSPVPQLLAWIDVQ
jgi:hypothetical protein